MDHNLASGQLVVGVAWKCVFIAWGLLVLELGSDCLSLAHMSCLSRGCEEQNLQQCLPQSKGRG